MDDTNWYLRKAHDGSQFGPIPFSQLLQWSAEAQISPLDRVSTDEATWVKAPMIPELEMDYLIHVSEDHYYGPTTVGSIREFLDAGEITYDGPRATSRSQARAAASASTCNSAFANWKKHSSKNVVRAKPLRCSWKSSNRRSPA